MINWFVLFQNMQKIQNLGIQWQENAKLFTKGWFLENTAFLYKLNVLMYMMKFNVRDENNHPAHLVVTGKISP